MPARDLYHAVEPLRLISPAVGTDDTAFVSQIIDMQGCDSCLLVILTGTLADTDATFTTLLEEGSQSDLSDNAAVADVDMVGTEALASFDYSDDDSVFKLGYIGNKRYIRLTITPANNTGNAPIAGVALRSRLSIEGATGTS